MRVADRIAVPALILAAADDPFVPPEPFGHTTVAGNPHITVSISPHGGHCAFLERPRPDYDGYWAEREVVRFVTRHAGASRD